MQDDWFPHVELPISWQAFHQLPRNAAYKYEYFNGKAWLSPRPKFYHALLQLQACQPVTEVDAQWLIRIRPLRDGDWETLPQAFSAAFWRVTPFSSMDDQARREAGRQCLEKTRTGGDGPLIEQASFVATSAKDEQHTVGAILVTLAPDRDLTDWDLLTWRDAPPADAVQRRLGRPHLTWIFVAPLIAGRGVGTALLSNATTALLELRYTELASTLLCGNDSSMLWHWRNGFQLLEYPGSMRRIRREIREAQGT